MSQSNEPTTSGSAQDRRSKTSLSSVVCNETILVPGRCGTLATSPVSVMQAG
jgi:hypothetical protein